MKRSTLGILILIILAATVTTTWYITKKAAEPVAVQTALQPQPAAPAQPQGQAIGIASGTDTIRMIFNKQNAAQVLWALQNQYPTQQNAAGLTVGNFVGTQNVFNYLEYIIVKKWPDLAPKKTLEPAPVKK